MENIINDILKNAIVSFALPAIINIIRYFYNKLKYSKNKWIVKEKEQNYMLDDQMNFWIFQLVKNSMYPLILVMFNFYVSLFICFYKDGIGIKLADVIVLVLCIVIYIMYFSLHNVKINGKNKDYSYVALIILGISAGAIIEVSLAPIAATSKGKIVYTFSCIVITVGQIIVNEIALSRTKVYGKYAYDKCNLYMLMKVLLMCLEVVFILLPIVCGAANFFETMEYVCTTFMFILLTSELKILHDGQLRQLEKKIYLKDGTIMTTCSGINEGENKTIEWKENTGTISIENSSIKKIAYFNHFNPKEVKKRTLTLSDGTSVSGYRYRLRNNSEWYGLCTRSNGGLEIELYPKDMVNIKQDENW